MLGVDDWAWRRGHRYGTALVDLERNRVVDLLPDRQADTLAAWLREHPGVEMVARDRAGAYADGIRQGAPEAIPAAIAARFGEVTNRWHLLRNLGEAVYAVVERHRATARRVGRFAEAARLHAAGASLSAISRLLGADRKTLRRWLQAGGVPAWQEPRRGSVLDPCRGHLERRWAEGCRNAARLWRKLTATGFPGRPATVRS